MQEAGETVNGSRCNRSSSPAPNAITTLSTISWSASDRQTSQFSLSRSLCVAESEGPAYVPDSLNLILLLAIGHSFSSDSTSLSLVEFVGVELLDVQPHELRFTFEPKKQSSCLIQLGNKSEHYVAFKVKTTSPKKYCVRPNASIIKPKATCDFTVTMQAQRLSPPDLQCKDKFLIQCTAVPFGTTDDDITSDMFAKDIGKYIEQKKLKVVLVDSPQSPASLPVNSDISHDPLYDAPAEQDKSPSGVENLSSPHKGVEELKTANAIENLSTSDAELIPCEDDEFRIAETIVSRSFENVIENKFPKEEADLLKNEVGDLKLKIDVLGSKLAEAEQIVTELKEARCTAIREKEMVEQQLALVRKNIRTKTVYVGFPLLYVCMAALISVALGYLMHG
ncbi:hypothetical protein Nepgr_021875 [Nepenthes gracilis]|uniref:MSP domain-containing protein n=1 Tax=Nepenthes gracilis TaxID=150966 RepID=A0AAD3SZE2_NEPGR|nr:hypothetical protein Nepgr_021875 [Nepenthes gracilis]